MNINFTKMHGCGNDYIYIDCFKQNIINPGELSEKLSKRHFSVGSDGLILVCPSEIADAKMRMFNSDGSEGKMCGNGIRCVGKFLYDNNYITDRDTLSIETLSGIKYLKAYKTENEVTSLRVDMGKPEFHPNKIPVNLDANEIINRQTEINGKTYNITCVSMGNPHCIVFVDDIDNIDIEKVGPHFENADIFPDRINTEFVQIIDNKTIKMRVWERGSGETFACGTGACASAVASVLNGFFDINSDITVKLIGGDLIIKYTGDTVYMTGPAEKVYDGTINYKEG